LRSVNLERLNVINVGLVLYYVNGHRGSNSKARKDYLANSKYFLPITPSCPFKYITLNQRYQIFNYF